MRGSINLCQTVYESLKGKIQCGLYPCGSSIPSSTELCEIYQISGKTVRRVVDMLVKDRLVMTARGKRPWVIYISAASEKGQVHMTKPDEAVTWDVVTSARLFSFPLLRYGISLCTEEDFAHLEAIMELIHPDISISEHYSISRQFWRFFIAKIGNDMILQCLDHMGYSELVPFPHYTGCGSVYQASLYSILSDMRRGTFEPGTAIDLLKQTVSKDKPVVMIPLSSPAVFGWPHSISKRIRRSRSRISMVYMDIIGRIISGEYKPGDRLPTHRELCETFGVSHDSTVRAFRLLRQLGVIRSQGGKSVIVLASDGLAPIWQRLDPAVIGLQFRLYIDALEALSLTIESVALCAADYIPVEKAAALCDDMKEHLDKGDLLYCPSTCLLELIVSHIPYRTLYEIYSCMRDYCPFNRIVPGLLRSGKSEALRRISQKAIDAVTALSFGDRQAFVTMTAGLYHMITHEILAYCKEMGYLEATLNVYDGTIFWK